MPVPGVAAVVERNVVTALISRRFSSAAAVKSEASHHHAPTMMMKGPTSAAPLKAQRPAALATSIACRLTSGEQHASCIGSGERN